jgi:tripeptidyl-peptidase-1
MSIDPTIHPPVKVPTGWQMIGEKAMLSGRMHITVGLKRSNMDKLRDVFEESSTPGRPGFLNHLSWEEMGKLVRPSDEALGAVIGALAANGATGIEVAPHGDYVTASVPMTNLESLTSSSFQTFVSSGNSSEKIYRIAGGIKLPASVAKYVDTFTGLHGFPLHSKPRAKKDTLVPNTLISPGKISQTYSINRKAVSRSGASNIQAIFQSQAQYTTPDDLTNFCKHISDLDPVMDPPVPGVNCSISKFVGKNDPSDPSDESMLDVEYLIGIQHAMGEQVPTWVYSYPGSDFCADLLLWAKDIAADAQYPYVVSMSYTVQALNFCDVSTVKRLSEDVQKFGAMGITVILASGDLGSGGGENDEGKLNPGFPASIPHALSVGSTEFAEAGQGMEQATTGFGSGGGFSWDFEVPSYQSDAIKDYLAKNPQIGDKKYASNGRGSPDVALLGSLFSIYADGEWKSADGTSASTPTWGGIISLLNEDCLSVSGGKKTLGFVNPLFYQNPDVFTDITKGDNAIDYNGHPAAFGGWKCTEGWDAVTGLGTPIFPKLQAVVKKACSNSAHVQDSKESIVV